MPTFRPIDAMGTSRDELFGKPRVPWAARAVVEALDGLTSEDLTVRLRIVGAAR